MKNIIVLFILSIMQFTNMNAFSQLVKQININVIHKEDSTSVPYLSVLILDKNGVVKESLQTNANGTCLFKITDSTSQKYTVKIQSLGYKPYLLDTIITGKEQQSLTILLEKDVVSLKEVVITDKQIAHDGAKTIYRIKQNQFSAATSVASLFNRLPGVYVMPSGDIKLNNRGNVLILIDGRGELKGQAEQMATLALLTADQIEKIEINPFPSGRYDASVEAVINIITKKKRNISNIRSSASVPLYRDAQHAGFDKTYGGISTNLNFKVKDVKVSFLMDARNRQSPQGSAVNTTIYNQSYYTTNRFRDNSSYSFSPELILDYDINKRSSIGLDVDVSFTPSAKSTIAEYYNFYNYSTRLLDSAATVASQYRRNSKAISLTSNYKYQLNEKKNSNLYVNLIYTNNPVNSTNHTAKTQEGLAETLDNATHSGANNVNASVIISNIVQGKHLSTELGAKSNTLNSNTQQQLNNEEPSLFKYHEQLSSLFLNTQWKYKSYELIAELRGELLSSHNEFIGGSETQQVKRNYYKTYPNVVLSKSFNNDLSLNLGYNKTIRRPLIIFLNPIQVRSFYSNNSGSAEIQPVYTDRFEGILNYQKWGLTLFHENIANQFMDVIPPDDPFAKVQSNLGIVYKNGFALNKSFEAGKWFSASANSYISFWAKSNDGGIYHKTKWVMYEFYGSANFVLSKKASIEASLYYGLPWQEAFLAFGRQVYSTLAYRQLLIGDKLSMNIAVDDLLGMQNNPTQSFYPTLHSDGRGIRNERVFSIQLNYKFPMSRQFKKQQYKKQNDGEMRKE